MNEADKLNDAQSLLIGRLFTLGGAILFLIGSFLAAGSAAKDLQDLQNTLQK